MDKVQKQLLDSYIRKREIATGEDNYGAFNDKITIKPYELLYLIKNNKLNQNKVDSSFFSINISNLIIYKPELIHDEDIKKYLSRLNHRNISWIISNRPELIDEFDKDLIDNIDKDVILTILRKQPQLLNRFDYTELSTIDVANLLVKQPQLVSIDFFHDKLYEFNKKYDYRTISGFIKNLSGDNIFGDEDERKEQVNKFILAFTKFPIYFELFKEYLYKLEDSYAIVDLVIADKNYLKYINLNSLTSYRLMNLIIAYPELMEKVVDNNNMLALTDFQIKRILKAHPELNKYFNN